MKRRLPIFLFFLFNIFSLHSQELISSEWKGSRTLQEMQTEFGIFMQNGIEMYKIVYTTPDVKGQLDTASGLLLLPVRSTDLVYPMLCYQHGTLGSKTDVPSNLAGGWEFGAFWSGLGYVVTVADFLGLGESRGFHPYVHADTEASAAIDMLRASRDFCNANGPAINDQLFITGYSQGGHGAAAVHLEIQENQAEEFEIMASAPMSGPYSISGEMVGQLLSDEEYFFPAYFPYTALSYDQAYDLFDNVAEYFKEPYATPIQEFYNGIRDLGSLNGELISLLTTNEGASIGRYMIQDSLIDAVEGNPDHPINLAMRDNDLYNWVPEAPTRLYYCTADDQVVYTNSVVADSVMNLNGASDTEAIDVDTEADHGGCVEPAAIAAAFFFSTYQELIPVTSTEELLQEKQPKVYPNPAREAFTLTNLPDDSIIRIFDAQSKMVRAFNASEEQLTIPVEGISAGFYLLKVTSGERQWTEMVMIQK